jgi:hypothetical protein
MAMEIADFLDGPSGAASPPMQVETRDFLTGFARELIQGATRSVAAEAVPGAGS